jgi:hypothetical protein
LALDTGDSVSEKKNKPIDDDYNLPVERWLEILVGMMHIPSSQVWEMSIREITLAINGFKEYNGNKSSNMDRDELDKLMEMYPDY